MTPLDKAAFFAVGKASGFALLAIFLVSVGFMHRPPLAAFAAGAMCLALAVVLRGFARWGGMRSYKKTETWLLIGADERPPAGIAQRVVSVALGDAYRWFARQTTVWGGGLVAVSIGLSLMGYHEIPDSQWHQVYAAEKTPFLAGLTGHQGLAAP